MKISKLKFIIIALLLNIAYSSNAQIIEKTDRKIIQEKKVKSQQTFEYEINKGKQATKGILTKELQFDNQGNVVKQINFKRDNSVHSILVYKYDDKGNKVQYEKYIGTVDSLLYKQNIKFDPKGKRVYEKGFDGLDSFRVVYNYNKHNKLAEAIYFSGKKIEEKRVFSYDNLITNIKVNNDKGVFQYLLQNIYDVKNNLIEEKQLDKNNQVSKLTKYAYNEQNLISSETKYVKDRQIEKTTYIYNNKNLLVEIWIEDEKMNKFQSGKNTYNDLNLLSDEQFRKTKEGDYSKNTYKYNDKNLCISVESYFATYKYQTLSVFTYDFY